MIESAIIISFGLFMFGLAIDNGLTNIANAIKQKD